MSLAIDPSAVPATRTPNSYGDKAVSWEAWLDQVEAKADLWESYTRRAKVSPDVAARLAALPGARKVLILVEDWCGDAIRSMPTVAAMAAASDLVEVAVLNLAEHPEALDSRLTRGARAVPIAVVMNEQGEEIGSWGPRPAALQAIVRRKIAEEGPPTAETKGEFYAPIMGWYAKDRGQAVAEEMLMLLERG